MRHWGGDHVFPGAARAKPAAKPASQVALSVPTHGEQGLAPRESPSPTGTKGETKAAPVVIPLSTAAEGSTKKRHQDKLLAQSFEQIEHAIPAASSNGKTPSFDDGDVGSSPAAAATIADAMPGPTSQEPMPPDKDQPTVSLFDDDARPHNKTDRKAYLREYMRARRQREREEKQRAAEAGMGAADQ